MQSAILYQNEIALRQVVESSFSLGECLKKLGLSFTGNSRVKLRSAIDAFGISTIHFKPNGRSGELRIARAKTLDEYLVLGSTISSASLKRKLWAAGRLPRSCQSCGLGEQWNGHHLVLQLDHINGNRRDNRFPNLRILCPNCHTQTHTFAGRGARRPGSPELTATEPKSPGRYQFTPPQEKIVWPDTRALSELVWSAPLSVLAKSLHVSDNAIRKRCKKLGLALPPFGHWQRERAKSESSKASSKHIAGQ